MNTINKRLIIVASLVIFVLAISFVNGGRTTAETNNQLPTGLVSRWPADGDALDVVGSNHGTLLNGATFAPGKVGQAFSLDGVDDVIDLGSNNIIGSGNAPFSVAMWMYPTRTPTGLYYFTIRLKQDAQFFIVFTQDFFGVPGGLVGAVFRAEAHQWYTSIEHASLVNQWTHVVVIYNGGNKADASSFAIFFNGVQLPTGSVDLGPVGGDCNDNALGSDAGPSCGDFGGNTHFQGLIDEIQIYNRALSPAEVQNIYNAGNVSFDIYLHGTGPNNNPSTLFLDNIAPGTANAKFKDSSGVNFNGGNPWKDIGTWAASPTLSAGILNTLNDLHVWLGLKNSDDQGTKFDLRAEIYKNGTLVAAGETYCITDLTRNAAQAKEATVSFGSFSPIPFNGTSDVLSLKIQTRIGTDGAGSFCGGHSNAGGLRLYFDAANRPSRFNAGFE